VLCLPVLALGSTPAGILAYSEDMVFKALFLSFIFWSYSSLSVLCFVAVFHDCVSSLLV